MFEPADGLGAFDAVLAAAAERAGASALVSADHDFASVRESSRVVPDAGGVAALLSS